MTDRRSTMSSQSDIDSPDDSSEGTLPRHIAIIMDGNGRWAQGRGLPRIEGHRKGVDTVRMVSETCTELGVEALTLYCLSSENWKRPETELHFLMQLLEQYLVEERQLIMDQGLQLKVIGRRDRLPDPVLVEMNKTLELSASNRGTKLVLAIDYGGRDEITTAVSRIANQLASGEIESSMINETLVSENLYTKGLPEVDLMIRTGGDMRVSNFLLWQLSYAELWVTETCWPEFGKQEFLTALQDFSKRQRRFGGLADSY